MSAPGNFALVAHGPIFIGTILNVCLYGISIAQTYMYMQTYKKDRVWMKILVGFIFLADTLNAVFDVEYTYSSLVLHYNDPEAIQKATWVFATDPALTSIVGTTVQLFFAWRVMVLTRSYVATGLLVVGSIISCLGGIATSIAIGIIPEWEMFQKFEVPVIIWLTVSALVDTSITGIMVWHLRKSKRGFKHSNDMLDRIIRLTVQTGLITSLWAVVDLIVFLSIPTGLHLIFNFPLSKLYSNSLLSSLNSRQGWKLNTDSEEATSAAAMNGNTSRRPADMVTFGSVPMRPEVFIDVESHEMVHVDDKMIMDSDKTLVSGASTPSTAYGPNGPPSRPTRGRPVSSLISNPAAAAITKG
ncbi:unnamed protein product [Peniophora sp. CBMAI 1063]|nr:unnamed protein product [Peniophora sp. CBMAI 1063]